MGINLKTVVNTMKVMTLRYDQGTSGIMIMITIIGTGDIIREGKTASGESWS